MIIDLTNPLNLASFWKDPMNLGHISHECGWVTPVKVRRQIYHTFFAGGAGHTYGAAPIWPMRGTGGDYSCGYTWKQALEFPAGANFAKVAKAFLHSHQWSQWVPDQSMLERGNGSGESLKTAITLESLDMALVYFSNNSHAKIKNTLNGAAVAHWFDPRNGYEAQAGSIEQHGVRDFVPPEGWEDAILVFRISGYEPGN